MGADRGGVSPKQLTLANLDQTAVELLKEAGNRTVWLIHGDMGTGKTTLIKALCRQLGAQGPLASPSFALVHEYRRNTGDPIYHLDLYRLKDQSEVLDLGIGEYVGSGQYCFIEWPERAGVLSGLAHVGVQLNTLDPQTRSLSLTLND